jgi:periplasmic copper chaperone A
MPAFLTSRRGVLCTGLALGTSLVLPARACEFNSANLRITHPWTRATQADASTAVVCMKFDEVRQPDRLIAVESPVAEGAQMGGLAAGPAVDLVIPAGQETLLSEAGTHVLLVGLKFPLEVARSYPLRLVFERGGVVEAMLSVDYTRFS